MPPAVMKVELVEEMVSIRSLPGLLTDRENCAGFLGAGPGLKGPRCSKPWERPSTLSRTPCEIPSTLLEMPSRTAVADLFASSAALRTASNTLGDVSLDEWRFIHADMGRRRPRGGARRSPRRSSAVPSFNRHVGPACVQVVR